MANGTPEAQANKILWWILGLFTLFIVGSTSLLTSTLGGMNSRQNLIEGQIGIFNERVKNLEAAFGERFKNVEAALATARNDVITRESRIADFNIKLSTLEGRMSLLERVFNFENRPKSKVGQERQEIP